MGNRVNSSLFARVPGHQVRPTGGSNESAAASKVVRKYQNVLLKHSLMPPKKKAAQKESSPTSWLYDDRTDCFSALVQIRTGDYLDLVKDAHEQRGGIAGQRDVLKTTTAKRIRDRMISDIQAGAVLPPVVIGVVVDDKTAQVLESGPHDQATLLQYIGVQELSIIDGMQRTASLLEAGTADSAVFDRNMRVEFWIAKSVRALIYRMLVLNTGQVPWTLARQLSVVYEPLLREIKQNVAGAYAYQISTSPKAPS
jgi:hypothetical protein